MARHWHSGIVAVVRDVQRAQQLLYDEVIRLDRVADPADLPHEPLRWVRTVTGRYKLVGTVLGDRSR
ncbi:hypothetical protein [Actinocatenispora rupis]|uniref:Uncharacterized protein n=1 Tax=Actinocatenispora rupis TaxID=519421 RepID=A0A8J3J8K2_9ACTN|nr:hypothetical protein [Actinocatenispora rupis]GID13922.1 hypothetical protein Aru02nite_48110 [Actinocatenispora rupis]